MKIFLTLALLLTSLLAHAGKNVEWDGEVLKIVYDLDDLQITESPNFDGVTLSMPGFSPIMEPGRPKLIQRSETFLIPYGLEVAECKYIPLRTDTIIQYCTPSETIHLDLLTDIQNNSASKAELIPYTGLWPLNSCELGPTEYYRGNTIGRFYLFPTHYDYENERIIIDRKFIVSISFKNSLTRGITPEPHLIDKQRLQSMISVLPEEFVPNGNVSSVAIPIPTDGSLECPVYFIITPKALESEAKRLADWKRKIGFKTIVKTVSNGWAASNIKNDIINAYIEYPKLEYVLLFGNSKLLKSNEGQHPVYDNGNRVNYETDYPFFCLDDSNDNIPDVYGGRLPIETLEEAETVVDKIISYEQNPSNDWDYVNTQVFFSEFHKPQKVADRDPNRASDDWDEAYFSETCHQIEEGLSSSYEIFGRSYIPITHHYAPSWANPKKFYSGKEMPFPYDHRSTWNSTAGSLFENINYGSYLVGIRGHGNKTAWTNAFFDKSYVKDLKNGDMLPVILSFACLSGDFKSSGEEQSLCTNFLTHKGGGAIACIGASNLTWSPYNDYYFAGLYDAMYPYCAKMFALPTYNSFKPVLYPPANTLGEIMETGRMRLRECFETTNNSYRSYYLATQEMYHILGDPSIAIRRGEAIKRSPNFVKQGDSYVLKDPRKLVVSSNNVISNYFAENTPLTISKLKELLEKYTDMYLVGNIDYQANYPEPITLSTLDNLVLGGSIISVTTSGDTLEIMTENCQQDNVHIANYDIYGNVIDLSNVIENSASLKNNQGVNIVILENENGCIIDSKRIYIR